ncbi:MAG: nucleoside hydrolase [Anaerolineae bacterium]
MLKRFVLLLVILLFSVSVSLAQTDMPRRPFIIDTDMAGDDWMGILYLLQRTDIEVLAITVTGTGEAHCDPGVQNAMNLLLLAGYPDVPVACGSETPLQGDHVFPTEWRDSVDAMAGIELEANTNPHSELSAVELLSEQLTAADVPVTLVTLGPLTNVAQAFQAEPTLIDHLERIYIMGGAVTVPGNLYTDNTTAEWNIYVDPLAASLVFESGAPLTLVGLDATNQTPMTMDFYNRIAEDRTTPAAEFVYQTMTANLDGIRAGWMSFWDPLAAAAASDPSIITLEAHSLIVVTEEGAESGRTMSDASGSPVDVAVGADAPAFESLFLDVLNGREPAISATPDI